MELFGLILGIVIGVLVVKFADQHEDIKNTYK